MFSVDLQPWLAIFRSFEISFLFSILYTLYIISLYTKSLQLTNSILNEKINIIFTLDTLYTVKARIVYSNLST